MPVHNLIILYQIDFFFLREVIEYDTILLSAVLYTRSVEYFQA